MQGSCPVSLDQGAAGTRERGGMSHSGTRRRSTPRAIALAPPAGVRILRAMGAPGNEELADLLDRIADLLAVQDADGFRVRAYRGAAGTARGHAEPLAALCRREGVGGLEALPGIGRSIAGLLAEYLDSGRCPLLDRLEGQVSPEALFATVPGIGPKLASRIHDELHLDTLEELEVAAHDGRLAALPGIGARRTRALADAVGGVLQRAGRRRGRRLERRGSAPSVGTLLAVDAEYLAGARAGTLRRLAPRRFNPEGEAWLPILHRERDGWSFTALFSNTARAHRLGRTRDWVVLYHERDGEEGQCTVVTEGHGPLAGRRVVRGREDECRAMYASAPRAATGGRPRRRHDETQGGPDGRAANREGADDPRAEDAASQRPAERRRRADEDGAHPPPAGGGRRG